MIYKIYNKINTTRDCILYTVRAVPVCFILCLLFYSGETQTDRYSFRISSCMIRSQTGFTASAGCLQGFTQPEGRWASTLEFGKEPTETPAQNGSLPSLWSRISSMMAFPLCSIRKAAASATSSGMIIPSGDRSGRAIFTMSVYTPPGLIR